MAYLDALSAEVSGLFLSAWVYTMSVKSYKLNLDGTESMSVEYDFVKSGTSLNRRHLETLTDDELVERAFCSFFPSALPHGWHRIKPSQRLQYRDRATSSFVKQNLPASKLHGNAFTV